ncbi:MAG: hypothetical protein IPG11_15865 [Flavobacteriales bacterium]|nr:hypothetical protein [Flavobacteriales bacterium]
MKLWLPDPASDDTTFQYEHTGHEFDENSPKRESTMPPHISIVEYRDGKGENFGNRVMNVRMSKEHQGDKFQLTVAFSATLADMQNKLPDIMITDGLYQSGWIREPKKPFMEPTTHTAGPDGKFASFGYAFTYGGKTADPNVRYVLVTNVFKYYNDRKNNIPVGKEIEKLFAEELRKSRYKPETHLAKDLLGTTTRILPWDGEKSLSTVANIRADRIAGWKEHGQPEVEPMKSWKSRSRSRSSHPQRPTISDQRAQYGSGPYLDLEATPLLLQPESPDHRSITIIPNANHRPHHARLPHPFSGPRSIRRT